MLDRLAVCAVLAPFAVSQAGTLDPTFSGGTVVTAMNPWGVARAVATHADGRVVVVGEDRRNDPSGAQPQWAVRQYLADGSPDATFGTNGAVNLFGLGGWAAAEHVAIDASGRILVCGSDETPGFLTVRLTSDGSLDPTFGDGGVVRTEIQLDSAAVAVAVQPDGKIVVAGVSIGRGKRSSIAYAVVRYEDDGSLDTTSFGPPAGRGKKRGSLRTTGIVVDDVDPRAHDEVVRGAIALQPDGKILVAGSSGSLIENAWIVARYRTDGSLDTSFADGGHLIGDFGLEWERLWGIAVQPDGGIVTAGRMFDAVFDFDGAVARYLADGTPDSTFGQGGLARTFLPGEDQCLTGPVILPQGQIVIGLNLFVVTDLEATTFRFTAGGWPDPSYGVNGLGQPAPLPGRLDNTRAITLDPSSRVVAAGITTTTGADPSILLFRHLQ